MEEKKHKYILLSDRVGEHIEKGYLMLSTKTVPAQFIRGQIFEALPEAEQPEDNAQISLTEIQGKGRLVCPTCDVARLAADEAELLSAVTSNEERHRIFRERNRLHSSKDIDVESKVYVKVKGSHKDVPGVVWYKGSLPTHNGTMFGVELLGKEGQGQGTSDGIFRTKRYFTCPNDCGVFVALDKIRQQEIIGGSSPKKEPYSSNNKSRISSYKNYLSSMFGGGTRDAPEGKQRSSYQLKNGQRVVTFVGDKEARGIVRYVADKPDDSGMIAVGIELDKRLGKGTGIFRSHQRFVCKSGFAVFVPADEVIPEGDFDAKPGPHLKHDTNLSASLGYEVNEKNSDGRELRRSNSTSSPRSNGSEEALNLAAGGAGETSESVVKAQEEIFAQIKADQEKSKPENQSEEMAEETMEIDENHFTSNSRLNADSYAQMLHGRSNFYVPSGEPQGTSSGWGSDGRQPVAPLTRNYEVLARGMTRRPISSPMMATAPGGNYNKNNYLTRNTEFYGDLPCAGGTEIVTDSKRSETKDLLGEEKLDAVEVNERGEILSPADQLIEMEQASSDMNIDFGLEVGSMVEIPLTGTGSRYGVIRWIGELPELKDKLVAGLELEEEQTACSDGMFNGQRYFTCPAGRGFFVLLQHCRRDSRFQSDSAMDITMNSGKSFGSMESPSITGIVPPPVALGSHSTGRMRGIQGHHNSCYLDSTLYSMFSFTTAFDTLLHRAKDSEDLEEYEDVQMVLRDEIVNPLRKMGFVRADRVLKLRRLLDKLGSTSGLTHEEKDPEEFLNTLLQQVLRSAPLLQLKSHGNRCEESNYYQIITEKDETIKLASAQKLLEQSFISADIKLAEVPSCLILQMPRFGNKYKMYDIILPDLTLDITHILENVPRPCAVCGEKPSTFECKECYLEKIFSVSITSFCRECSSKVHGHPDRVKHQLRPVIVPREYSQYARRDGAHEIDKQIMELFAVVCIATSHYVAFVKCGLGIDAPWCFFDSMADRKGESNGYNIPAVTMCPEATKWLSSKPEELISAMDRGELSPNMKRLFGDAYMCMYQSMDMGMYK